MRSKIEDIISQCERLYSLPVGSITENKNVGRPTKINGINLSSIRQVLSIYFKEERRMVWGEIGKILGYKDHTGALKSYLMAMKYIRAEDYEFMKTMHEIYKTIFGKATKLPVRKEKPKKMYAIPTVVKKTETYEVKPEIKRPVPQYSNTNNIQQYYE